MRRIGLCVFSAVLGGSICLGSAVSAADRVVLDRVAAVVNAEVVLESEVLRSTRRSPLLQEAMAQLPANATDADRRAKERQVQGAELERLIDRLLVQAEAEKFQISATEEDIDRALPTVAENNGMTVAELRAQVEEGDEYASWAEYRKELQEEILYIRTTSMLAPYRVTDAQVREHYRKMTRDEQARVDVERFVFAPSDSTSTARDRAFARAQSVVRRLRSSEPGSEVAAAVGYAGEIEASVGRGEIAPTLEDAVFQAKENEVVGPLASGQGYVVFRIRKHHASSALAFEEAQVRIRMQLEQEALIKAEAEFKRQLRARAHIDIRL